MALKIATNVISQQVQNSLSSSTKRSGEALQKLSSGSRINKAGDDAAGLAIVQRLRATTKSLAQATRNANDGISYIQTAEGALNETSNIVIRLRELAIQASSDTIGDNERALLDQERIQLVEEIDRIAHSTEFNGSELINGQGKESLSFHIGYKAGDENKIVYNAGHTDATTSSLGIDSLDISNQQDAESGIERLDEAIDHISGFRANLGSLQSRLQSTINNLHVQRISQDSARSAIQDTDVAEQASQLARLDVIKQAGIASLASANSLPNSALRLLI
ncbi:MAG: flagellin [Bacteriovoracales bacterium]|nr:flagellin [Bacteriovoracales bacterium]